MIGDFPVNDKRAMVRLGYGEGGGRRAPKGNFANKVNDSSDDNDDDEKVP